jgi:peptidoglycan hydrolase CwlO-like protein
MTPEIIMIVSNILTSLTSFLIGKRMSAAQTDNQVLLNLELSVNLYKGIIDDLKKEITELNGKIDLLEKKVDELMTENKKLKSKL